MWWGGKRELDVEHGGEFERGRVGDGAESDIGDETAPHWRPERKPTTGPEPDATARTVQATGDCADPAG